MFSPIKKLIDEEKEREMLGVNAGRNEIYYSVFDYNFQKIEPTNFKELNTKSFEKYLDSESVYFVGYYSCCFHLLRWLQCPQGS